MFPKGCQTESPAGSCEAAQEITDVRQAAERNDFRRTASVGCTMRPKAARPIRSMQTSWRRVAVSSIQVRRWPGSAGLDVGGGQLLLQLPAVVQGFDQQFLPFLQKAADVRRGISSGQHFQGECERLPATIIRKAELPDQSTQEVGVGGLKSNRAPRSRTRRRRRPAGQARLDGRRNRFGDQTIDRELVYEPPASRGVTVTFTTPRLPGRRKAAASAGRQRCSTTRPSFRPRDPFVTRSSSSSS